MVGYRRARSSHSPGHIKLQLGRGTRAAGARPAAWAPLKRAHSHSVADPYAKHHADPVAEPDAEPDSESEPVAEPASHPDSQPAPLAHAAETHASALAGEAAP